MALAQAPVAWLRRLRGAALGWREHPPELYLPELLAALDAAGPSAEPEARGAGGRSSGTTVCISCFFVAFAMGIGAHVRLMTSYGQSRIYSDA